MNISATSIEQVWTPLEDAAWKDDFVLLPIFGCLIKLQTEELWLCAVVPTFEEVEKRNCLAMLAFVSLLWCTEALPLYVTSMLVPFLTVVLGVMVDTSADPPHRLTPKESAPKIFHTMFSQVSAFSMGFVPPDSLICSDIPQLCTNSSSKLYLQHRDCQSVHQLHEAMFDNLLILADCWSHTWALISTCR